MRDDAMMSFRLAYLAGVGMGRVVRMRVRREGEEWGESLQARLIHSSQQE